MKILKMNPGRGYLSADLFLPLEHIHFDSIRNALRFWVEDRGLEEGGYWLEQFELLRDHVRVPRHFIPATEYSNLPYPIVDLRPPKPHHSFRSLISKSEMERRWQLEAADRLEESDHGTLNLSCGRGKSVLTLHKIAVEQTPSIIILPTTALLEQWKETIPTFLEFKGGIGIVQGPKFDWEHPIVLAMIQTLALKTGWPEKFRRHFGLVFYDEGDLVGAPKFSRAASLFYGDRYSLTATAQRGDGNEAIYQFHLGHVFHSDLRQKLTPTLNIFRTGIDYPRLRDGSIERPLLRELCPQNVPENELAESEIHHGRLCGWLGQVEERNEIILQELRRARDKGRVIIVLSKSVDHLKTLHELHPDSGLLIGDTEQAKRLQELRSKQVVFATLHLARRGLDREQFDTEFLISPFKSHNDYQQAAGRILRESEEKLDPVIVFFQDDIGTCAHAGMELKRHARKHGHKIKELE